MRTPRVLVVDADPEAIVRVGRALEGGGYRLLGAADAKGALVEARRVDCVLVDLDDAPLDGWRLCERIRALPGGTDLPILACASDASPATQERAARLALADVLPKPVHPEILAFRVARAVAARIRPAPAPLPMAEPAAQTRRARQPFEVRGGPAPALSGALEHIALATVLNLLSSERRTGRLEVVSAEDASSGTLEMREGRVWRARADAPDRPRARDAVFRMLGWPAGTFRFYPVAVDGTDEVQLPTLRLLLEGARVNDEASEPPEIVGPAPAEPPDAGDIDIPG